MDLHDGRVPSDDLWPKLPTQSLLELLAPRIAGIDGPFPALGSMGGMGGGMRSVDAAGGFGGQNSGAGPGPSGGAGAEPFFQIGHCLFALLAATLGAFLSKWLFGAAADESRRPSPPRHLP